MYNASDFVSRKIAGKDVEPAKKSFLLPYLGAAAGVGIQKVAVSDTSKALSLLGMDPSAVTRTAGRTHRLTTQPRYADALMKAKNLPMLATALSSGALMLGGDEMQDKVLQAASVGLPASYLPRLIEEVDAAGRGAAMFSRGGKSFLKKFMRSGKGLPTTLAMAMSAGMIPYLLRKSKMLEEEPRKTAKANPEVLSGKDKIEGSIDAFGDDTENKTSGDSSKEDNPFYMYDD